MRLHRKVVPESFFVHMNAKISYSDYETRRCLKRYVDKFLIKIIDDPSYIRILNMFKIPVTAPRDRKTKIGARNLAPII